MNEIIIPWIIHCRFLINFSMNLIAIRKKIFFSIRCKHPLIEFLRHPVERGCGQPFSPTESLSLHRRKADCELLGSQLNESCGIVSRYSRITQFLWLLLNLSFIPGKRDRWESGERRNKRGLWTRRVYYTCSRNNSRMLVIQCVFCNKMQIQWWTEDRRKTMRDDVHCS